MKTNLDIFLDAYKEQLRLSHQNNPEQYVWPLSELETVFNRMKQAIQKGSYNKDSSAFKATCKELKIKHTYLAIDCFIGKETTKTIAKEIRK
jgi:hypothetical protein